MRDARFAHLISGVLDVQCRLAPGTGLASPETGRPKSTFLSPQPSSETAPLVLNHEIPANCGHFVGDQRTSVRTEVRGGPGRTRTSSQTIMSGRSDAGAARSFE